MAEEPLETDELQWTDEENRQIEMLAEARYRAAIRLKREAQAEAEAKRKQDEKTVKTLRKRSIFES